MPIETRYRHTLVIKRMVATGSGGAETVGGADTTLAADTAAGDLTISVADATDIADGDWLRVGDEGETEVRQVAIDGVAGSVVTLTAELDRPHDSGDQVRELDGPGDPALDDYGQPVPAPEVFATVAGLIQPRSAREVALTSQAGVVIGSHVGYMAPLTGLTTHDWIERAGLRYDIVSIADAGGVGHHWELGLQAVT